VIITEGKIITDICVLVFFMILIALRKYLFTERFSKFLKENWFVFGLAIVGFLMIVIPEEPSPYQNFIVIIGAFLIVYFFVYSYFSVHILSLRNRRGIWKKWQILYVSIAPILPIYRAYEYFTTKPYHSLDIVIFVFFLGTVVFVSRFLLKEMFFSKGKGE